MKITYFHRNNNSGYSIGRVFHSITQEIIKTVDIEEFHVPFYRARPLDLLRNMYFVFRHRNKKGINHITGDIHYCILPLLGCKTVLTVHDLVTVEDKNIIKRFLKWFLWIYLPVRYADKITCISAKTESTLLKSVKTPKTNVIHNPIDPYFKYTPKEFNKEKPRILHIGCGWNKNLERVIEAIKDIPCHLRIIGKISQEQITHLKNSQVSFSHDKNLTDQQILDEYKQCDIVSFPSIYEGFGMPLIEGQMTGRVVVTSNIEPLIEIGGSGACFVDPYDSNSIKEGFSKIIVDDKYRNLVIANGIKNVKRFSIKNIASDYIKLYTNLNIE